MKAQTFLSLLLLLFVGLKLADIGIVADWSWWLVMAPLWLPVALFVLAVVIGFVIAAYLDSKGRLP